MCASVTEPTTSSRYASMSSGEHLDQAVGQLLIDTVTPLALEVTLTVQQEMQARLEEVDRLRKKQVERARYEADLGSATLPSRRPGEPAGSRFARGGLEQQTSGTECRPGAV